MFTRLPCRRRRNKGADPLIVGSFMFHCHVLSREDRGMMANIEVYDPVRPTLPDRFHNLYLYVWWRWHGVPWSICGPADT
jgi:Multicopper oxidase